MGDHVDQFRTIIRSSANHASKPIAAFLSDLFEFVKAPEGSTKMLTFDDFEKGICTIRDIRRNLKRTELSEIFEECDENAILKISLDELSDFCQRSLSRARILALKLRKAIRQSCQDTDHCIQAFASISGNSKYADVDSFRDFAEDMLPGVLIKESDSLALYSLFDTNGDGKVSLDDFLGFIQPVIPDASRVLDRINPECIIDVRISLNKAHDADLDRQGYIQITPASLKRVNEPKGGSNEIIFTQGTFGKGQSLWVWKAKQGTCSGKLKPIVDIQLETSSVSTALVISGYTCLPIPISSQWVWVKRAATVQEELDSIVDFQVTTGRMSIPTDQIWSGPGPGWIRIDGNWSKGFMSSVDTFVWFLPARERSMSNHMSSPVRTSIFLSEEDRKNKLLLSVRQTLRHFVPVERMKQLSDPFYLLSHQSAEEKTELRASRALHAAETIVDLGTVNLFHQYSGSKGVLTLSKFQNMLMDIGVKLDKPDYKIIFHYFDVKQDKSITREEFYFHLSLTDYDLDKIVDTMKEKLRISLNTVSQLKYNRMIHDIFRIINTDGTNILSLVDIMALCARFLIFVTEEEARKLKSLMDMDSDDKVTEVDFLQFMKQNLNFGQRSGNRIRDAAALLRRWLLRGNTNTAEKKRHSRFLDFQGNSLSSAIAFQWKELELNHERSYGTKFPGYLVTEDFYIILGRLGCRLSHEELKILTMVLAPESNGRVLQPDLELFMNRQCRSFGELIHILEMDLLKPLLDVCKELRKEYVKSMNGIESEKVIDLTTEYEGIVEEIVKGVQDTPKTILSITVDKTVLGISDLNPETTSKNKAAHLVVSITQVKAGIEHVMRGYSTPQNLLPNHEEWVCLACIAGSIVTDEESHGLNIKLLIEGLCNYICGNRESCHPDQEISLDMICRDIYRIIMEEVRLSNPPRRDKSLLDYSSAFALFDEDGNGEISAGEFQRMLIRLQLFDLLPEGKISSLLTKFDTKNKGYITVEDFKTFIENFGESENQFEDDYDFNDSDEGEDDYGLSSNTPPIAITKNSDLDWLVWSIYKEACKIDPIDPESVISELESACVESEIIDNAGSISKKELWSLLFELKLKGNITAKQYDQGLSHLMFSANEKSEEILVDYESLCRHIIRMGRAFNAMAQEKGKETESKYQTLKNSLLGELTSMVSAESKNGSEVYRYEKVFRRMDNDGDGRISIKEFKVGLRRLKCKNEKRWTFRLIRRLFDDCDKNGDGLISLREFTSMIKVWKSGANPLESDETNHFEIDDEADDTIFRKEKLIYDSELFRKISSSLLDVVPPSGNTNEDRIETVKSTVRKFFQRSDPDQKGIVSEERFRAFCRRSGLQEVLTTSEIRTLMERLKKRRGKLHGANVLDYERFLYLLSKNAESIPHSRGEAVLAKIQDAVVETANAGRPFLALCSLTDQKLTGFMSPAELLHTFKMMGITVTSEELRSIQELLPSSAISNEGNVDYRELFWIVQTQTTQGTQFYPDTDGTHRFNFPPKAMSFSPNRNASNPFSTFTPIPQNTNRYHPELETIGFEKSTMSTPIGTFVSTPLKSDLTRRDYLDPPQKNQHISDLIGKVKSAIAEKNRLWGTKFHLQKQFEVYDSDMSGYVSLSIFQTILDNLSVALSAPEIYLIRSQYGRYQDDTMDYLRFCQDVNNPWGSAKFTPSTSLQNSLGAPRRFPNVRTFLPPPSRLSETLRSLRNSGRDPRDIFQAYDLDNTGMVDLRRFKEVVQKLELLQTSSQLSDAIENYGCISDRNLICYEDFCQQLENHASIEDEHSNRHSNGSEMVEKWYQTASPRDRQEFDHVFDSLDRYRSTMEPKGDEFGSSALYLPPKPSESYSRLKFNKIHTRTSSTRDGIAASHSSLQSSYSPRYASPLRYSTDRLSSSGGSLNPPRSPPSKVGSVMWGNETPLSHKGHAPRLEDCWVCSVCYFTENPHTAKFCEICQSANYHNSKDFQIKRQCSNCTFLNGHFARECEMCGDKL